MEFYNNKISTGEWGIVKGDLPKGCEYCIKGLKSVIFVTGKCTWPWWCRNFCPVSLDRKNYDVIFVNELKIDPKLELEKDILSKIINEIEISKSEGASITGGEPLLVFKRTLKIIYALKDRFGKDFHIHLYTNGELLNKDKIQKLFEVGLDEIRLHTFRESKIKLLKYAKELGISIGLEYPAYPSYRKYIVNAIKLADKLGMDFVNINEFEVTDSTLTWAVRNGLIVSNTGVTVKGSEHFAKFILGWSIRNTKNISVHYCPFWVKDTIQYKNRLKIRAKSIKKSYERITHDGLLLKGCLIPKDNNVINSEIISEIKKLFSKYNYKLYYNCNKKRYEFSVKVFKDKEFISSLIKKLKRKYQMVIIEEMPTHDRTDVNITPLSFNEL
ncbi:MAG: radical SAM protein [Candidatus Asgardarchaeia archaeon]